MVFNQPLLHAFGMKVVFAHGILVDFSFCLTEGVEAYTADRLGHARPGGEAMVTPFPSAADASGLLSWKLNDR